MVMMIKSASELPALEQSVLRAAEWWHAEINRTRSASAFSVSLEDFELELFNAIGSLLDARYHLSCTKGISLED